MTQQHYDYTLSTYPNTIVKLFRNTTPFVIKIYKGQSEDVLKFLMCQIQNRSELYAKFEGQSQFPQKIQVRLDQDAQMKSFLHIQSPFMTIQHLPITTTKLRKIMGQLVNGIIKGHNCFFYCLQNIFYDETKLKEVSYNWTSNSGLAAVLLERPFSKKEFAEVYELMDPQIFERNPEERMNYKLKFRAIGVIIICFCLGKRISLILQSDKIDNVISIEQVKIILSKSKERIKQVLCHPHFRKNIDALQQSDKCNYLFYLKRVFIDDCEDLTWFQAISLLFCQRKPEKESNFFAQVANTLYEKECAQNRKVYESLGLSEKINRQLYLLMKAKVNLSSLFRYRNIDDYLGDGKNWNIEKQRICKALINTLTNSNELLTKNELLNPLQQEEIPTISTNSYEQFQPAYSMLARSMNKKSIRVQSREIKFMSNYERILKQYQNL